MVKISKELKVDSPTALTLPNYVDRVGRLRSKAKLMSC